MILSFASHSLPPPSFQSITVANYPFPLCIDLSAHVHPGLFESSGKQP